MQQKQQQETLVETLRRSLLHLIDSDDRAVDAHSSLPQPLSPYSDGPTTVKELQQQIQTLQQQNQELLRQHQLVEQDCLGSLGRIAQRLQSSLDETDMFQTVIQELVKVLNLLNCQIRLYNADGSMVMARHEYIRGSELGSTPKICRIDFPLETIEAPPESNQFCPLIPPERQALTVLQYPLMDGMGMLGTLQLERHQPDWFSLADLNFVQQVAAQCAIALRRNRFAQISKTQSVELKHLNQLQDTFLGTVSYELRIPLANIRMAIQMITMALTKESENAAYHREILASQGTIASQGTFASLGTIASQGPVNQETVVNPVMITDATLTKVLQYLEVLQRECDRETKLIQDLLDLQQLDTDTLSLVMSAIDLEEWLPYVLSPFQKRCQEYNLALQCQIPSELPAFMCDQITLSRIVAELIGNAIKFTPAHGQVIINMAVLPKPDSATELADESAQASPDTLRIQICNTGVEIPIEEQGKIFDKFYRLSKLDIRKLGGTGLGLALVEKLVQRLGGNIELQSHHQQTTFIVDLPFQNELRS